MTWLTWPVAIVLAAVSLSAAIVVWGLFMYLIAARDGRRHERLVEQHGFGWGRRQRDKM